MSSSSSTKIPSVLRSFVNCKATIDGIWYHFVPLRKMYVVHNRYPHALERFKISHPVMDGRIRFGVVLNFDRCSFSSPIDYTTLFTEKPFYNPNHVETKDIFSVWQHLWWLRKHELSHRIPEWAAVGLLEDPVPILTELIRKYRKEEADRNFLDAVKRNLPDTASSMIVGKSKTTAANNNNNDHSE